MAPEIETHATLMFALSIPGVDLATVVGDSDSADMFADEFALILNEERERNDPENWKPVMVSAIPGPRWVTPATIDRLRYVGEFLGEDVQAVLTVYDEHIRKTGAEPGPWRHRLGEFVWMPYAAAEAPDG